MEIRQAYLSMIKAFSGGWDAIAPALGMSRNALENRIYERKGQAVDVQTALQMQEFSHTTLFAEAIASASGGTFIKLPQVSDIENDSIQTKFNQAYAELGRMFAVFLEITEDGVIDEDERARMIRVGEQMHQRTEELMGLMFSVYCVKTQTIKTPRGKKSKA